MPEQTFIVNGNRVTVDVEDDVRLLWVLRDRLGITGPKYGCGINVCKACTSHINGKAFNPCAVPVGQLGADDEVTTIEGLPDQVEPAQRGDHGLHPMQEAWLDRDVAQCGYCQPGQIMAAVALVNRVSAEGGTITDADLDTIRNICRCGTYTRIREAIRDGAERM
ncbi:(2Fe-2S)-binding protein [Nocardioides zhouii]|uniref:(2Fe-2S)-binding protein n=1 Tax=Nocardioides zhouii TaxID=1168729 RepID=A0A4Q2SP60_9ACTN|nr:(2Fe-2S)-binding protein [Nocardioides zhouii]RYC07422.1 (2Fe-2S)-binding protein [Nocardioides zhouii]